MTGKIKEAKAVLQVGMYRYIITLFGIIPPYLTLCAELADERRFQRIVEKLINNC